MLPPKVVPGMGGFFDRDGCSGVAASYGPARAHPRSDRESDLLVLPVLGERGGIRWAILFSNKGLAKAWSKNAKVQESISSRVVAL